MSLKDKILFILFFLLILGFCGGLHLRGEESAHNNNGHIIAQLACQAPPHERLTNKVIGTPDPVYKDHFGVNEEIWVAVNPKTCAIDYKYKEARLYVVNHRSAAQWQDNTRLKDVSTDGYEMITIQPGCANNNYTRIWEKPSVRDKGYDVVVDFPPLGYYNKGRDILDGLERKGFSVPWLWVCIESISFNYNHDCNSSIAIDIRKNQEREVRVPEWKKGECPWPAAYIKNKSITINAIFSAACCIKSAKISADTISGDLGNIIPETVSFNEDGFSSPVFFQVSSPAPNNIRSFFQEWRWYYEDVNALNSPKIHIGDSINKIYILLSEPWPPWTKSGPTEPWTDVLDLVCLWTDGQTTQENALEKIIQELYCSIGGQYLSGAETYSVGGSSSGDFKLSLFLQNIPKVYRVNCYDMGKAAVTFSNVVGCNLDYKYSTPFGCLCCVKLIGKDWSCKRNFRNHAFAGIGDRISDACLVVDNTSNLCDCSDKPSPGWLINIPWDEYKKKVVKHGEPSCPETIPFGILGGSTKEPSSFFKKQLQTAKIKYDFANWKIETRKVIPGIRISEKTLPQLRKMEKVWKDNYSIEKIKNITYPVIQKLWAEDNRLDSQLAITMVVTPTFNAAKRYLIYHYATTSGKLPEREKEKDIGNICFLTTTGHGHFSSIDFIRYNVLIMIWARGQIKYKLKSTAGQLDKLLLKEKPASCYLKLKQIPRITHFSCEDTKIKWREHVPLHLEINNPAAGQVRCLWEMSGGGIEKDLQGNFIYYAEEKGNQKITVTAVNDLGLWDSKSLEIQVSHEE